MHFQIHIISGELNLYPNVYLTSLVFLFPFVFLFNIINLIIQLLLLTVSDNKDIAYFLIFADKYYIYSDYSFVHVPK